MSGAVLSMTDRMPARSDALAGLGQLLRFMIRRDRIRMPAWVLGMAMMLAYFANALGLVLDEKALRSFAAFAANPVMALIGGPGYGFEDITVGRFLVGMYGAYLMIGAALMSITTISRHTRVEEQTGRAELVRANVVGRHASLAAALILAIGMNVVMAALMTLVFSASEAGPNDIGASLLFACSVAAVGIVFAAVAAVTMQLSPFSRAASGMAGAVLAASFIVRGLGDMSRIQGGSLEWLSWLSPLGWSQQTAPLTLDRWWPLLISLGVSLVLIYLGFALQSRRDLGAGILPDRLGSATAPAWLNSAVSIAFRLQRATLAWWSASMLAAGVIFGAFVQPMADNAAGMPPEILAMFGGTAGMIDGYLGFMALYFAVFVSVFALLSLQALKGEEYGVRTEPVLATAVTRRGWVFAWLTITVVGSVWLLALAGLGEGLGAAMATGDWGLVGPTFLGHIAQVPAVWLLVGVGVALYGFAPRLLALTWLAFGYSTALAMFGDVLSLDDSMLKTSVFRHIGQYPAVDLSAGAIGVLTLVAAVLMAVGIWGFQRRDLITA